MNFFPCRSKFITCKNTFLLQLEFSPLAQIFTLHAQLFTTVIDVCPCAYCETVTNSLTAVIEVVLIDDALS